MQLPSELLEQTWVNRAPNGGADEDCLVTAFFNMCGPISQWVDILNELITGSPVDWNDAPGRTKQEVVALAKLVEMKLGLRPLETESEPELVAQPG